MRLRPKNWDSFQHYKDRRPAWIKLHHTLIESMEFHSLKGEDAKYLVMIWLIASEDYGYLPPNPELAFRLRISPKQCEQLLARLQAWIVYDASKPLAELEQPAIPEKEIEEEIEEETEKEEDASAPPSAPPFVLPDWLPQASWTAYLHMRRRIRKPMTDYAKELALRKLEKWRSEGQDVGMILDNATEHSWTGLWPVEERNGNRNRSAGKGQLALEAAREAILDLAGDEADGVSDGATGHGGRSDAEVFRLSVGELRTHRPDHRDRQALPYTTS